MAEIHKIFYDVKVIRYGHYNIKPKDGQLSLDLQTKPTLVTFTNINNNKEISIPLSRVLEIEYNEKI